MPINAGRWIEILCWGAGLCLFAIYDAALGWSSYASNQGLEAMHEARAIRAAERTPARQLLPRAESPPPAVLRIPSIRLEVPVYAGTSGAVLNRGAGLIEGTALPTSGEGNIAIAAHRDTFFRALRGIKAGDELYLDTVSSTRRYRVTRISVVAPQDVSVLAATAHSSITLVTCYPFHFVGAAPQRFIVRAEIARSSSQHAIHRHTRGDEYQ